MLKRLAALTALVTVTACTPTLEQLAAWVAQQEGEAVAAGVPCPQYADELAWRQLPDHFHHVIDRETGGTCDPSVVNRSSGALGLTQIMPFWLEHLCPAGIACTETDLLDVEANLDAAAYVYAVQGAEAWSQTW